MLSRSDSLKLLLSAFVSLTTLTAHAGEVHEALFKGEVDKAQLLLAKDPSLVHSRDPSNWTPLHVAAHCGHVEVVKWLLEHSADVDARAHNGFTPLHVATDPKVAKVLLEYRADIEAVTSYGDTVLQRAAQQGLLPRAQHGQEVARMLIAAGASYDIRSAIYLNDIGQVRELLTKDPSVANTRSRFGYTPLHWAAELGHAPIVKLLLEHGAVVDAIGWGGYTPLAKGLAHPAVVKLLLEAGADATIRPPGRGYNYKATLLDRAVRARHVETVKLFLVYAADADLRAEKGFTPLHAAALAGHYRAALLLFREGFDAEARTASGWTPMSLAASKIQLHSEATEDDNARYMEVIKTLHRRRVPLDMFAAIALDKGERVGALLKADSTLANRKKPAGPALHYAVKLNRTRIVALLLSNGADVNVADDSGYTALHTAAFWGHKEIAQILIDHKADVNARTDQGLTPLHESARRGTAGVAKLLLAARADVNARDSRGRTPLASVGTTGNAPEVIKVLREYGATE